MDDASRDELRRLALWLSRRRAVDEAVEVLTAHGPAAGDRLYAHLTALQQLLALEHEAFDAVAAAAPVVPQLPLPHTLESGGRVRGTVHSLSAARRRSSV